MPKPVQGSWYTKGPLTSPETQCGVGAQQPDAEVEKIAQYSGDLAECASWLDELAKKERDSEAKWLTVNRKSPHCVEAYTRYERWAASLRTAESERSQQCIRYGGERDGEFNAFWGEKIPIRVYDRNGHTIIAACSMEVIEHARTKNQLSNFKQGFESANHLKCEADKELEKLRTALASHRERERELVEASQRLREYCIATPQHIREIPDTVWVPFNRALDAARKES